MMTKEQAIEIERTLECNAVYIRDEIDGTVTLSLYSSTEGDEMIFTDRCGNLRSYLKSTYGTEWKCFPVEFKELVRWDDVAEPIAKAFGAVDAGEDESFGRGVAGEFHVVRAGEIAEAVDVHFGGAGDEGLAG